MVELITVHSLDPDPTTVCERHFCTCKRLEGMKRGRSKGLGESLFLYKVECWNSNTRICIKLGRVLLLRSKLVRKVVES